MVEAFRLTIGDRPVGKQRGKAALAGLQEFRLPDDVEKCLLLSGKARIRKVFGRGAGADGDTDVGLTGAVGQTAIGFDDGSGRGSRPVCPEEELADGCPVSERLALPAVQSAIDLPIDSRIWFSSMKCQ